MGLHAESQRLSGLERGVQCHRCPRAEQRGSSCPGCVVSGLMDPPQHTQREDKSSAGTTEIVLHKEKHL